MSDIEQDLEPLSSSQVSALLALGLTRQPPDAAEISRSLLAKAATDRTGDVLALILSDLGSPIQADKPGPLSLGRLLGWDHDDTSRFANETFLSVLTSPVAERPALEALVRYGELLLNELFPESTRLTGSVIRTLALSALKSRHDARLSAADAAIVDETRRFLAAHPRLPPSLSDEMDSRD